MKNKKILLLVPHQDDEIILCGSFLKGLVDKGHQTFVVYMTNGDYDVQIGAVRLQEALNVMKLYDIPENHVIFMGYANQYTPEGPHIYNAEPGKTLKSRFGRTKTYGLPEHPEYCYQRYGKHHLYQRENLIEDLVNILEEILPHVIFVTDVEMHIDHIANALFLYEAMGILLKKFPDFKPLIYKKQGYSTDWYAEADYSTLNNAATKKGKSYAYVNCEVSPFLDPYIRWEERIRIPVDRTARIEKKEENIVYKALQLYQSQHAQEHFENILNSDSVFWRRRTDSLTYRSQISVSSGAAEYINDFKTLDCKNIAHANKWCLNKGIWRPSPEDRRPVIVFELERAAVISEVVIYQEFCPQSAILRSRLVFDQSDSLDMGPLEKRRPTVVQFTPRKVSRLEYVIEEWSDANISPGISEIEIYEEVHAQLVQIKIMINDNFVYDYYVKGALTGVIGIYRFYQDGSTDIAPNCNDYEIVLSDRAGNVKEQYLNENKLQGVMEEAYLVLQVFCKLDKRISDKVEIWKTEEELTPDSVIQNNRDSMLLTWIALKQDGVNWGKYFEKHAYHSVAVYGLGEWGVRCIKELQDSGVTIKYVVDKNIRRVSTYLTLYSPEDELGEVDVLIVTVPHHFEEIKMQMSLKLRCPILSIEKIIYSLA